MANPKTQIEITALNKTEQAFREVRNDMSGLTDKLGAVSTAVGGLLPMLGSAGIVASLVSIGKEAFEAADGLSKLSDKTGISVERLSELKLAFDLSDVDPETFARGVRQLNQNLIEARDPASQMGKLFFTLRISTKDADASLRDAAEAISKIEDESLRAVVAMRLFGSKAGEAFVVALKDGSKGLDDAAEKARKLGLVMTQESAKAAEEFNDNLTVLGTTAKALGNVFVKEAAPGLASFTNWLVKTRTESEAMKGTLEKVFPVISNSSFLKNFLALQVYGAKLMAPDDPTGKQISSGKIGPKIPVLPQAPSTKEIEAALGTNKESGDKKDPYEAVTKRSKDFLAALEKETTAVGASISQRKLLEAVQIAGTFATEKERSAFLGTAAALATRLQAEEERLKFNEQIQKNIDKSREAEEKFREALQATVAEEQKLLDEQRAANDVFGLTKTQVIDLTIAKKELAASSLEAAEGAIEEVSALRQQIEILRQRKEAVTRGDELEASKKKLEEEEGYYRDFFGSVESAGREAFRNFGQEGENVSERIGKALKESVLDVLYQITIKKWTIELLTSITGRDENGKLTGGYSLLGGLFSAFTSGSSGGSGSGLGDYGFSTGTQFAAEGAHARAGQAFTVGERGRELFVPDQSGTIVPNHRLGGTSVVVNQSLTFNSSGQTDQRTLAAWAAQIQKQTIEAITHSIARNGPLAKVVRSA